MTTSSEKNPASDGRRVSGISRIAGALGIVLTASAPLTWILTGEGGVLLFGKLTLGVVLISVYLATNPRFWRRFIGARSTPLAVMSALTVVVAIAVVGAVNYVAIRNPKQFDATKEGLYTLSQQTQGVLDRLKDDVLVYAFYGNSEQLFGSVQDTLRRYQNAGKKLSFSMVDPQTRPDLVDKFKITERGPRIVVTARDQEARAKDPSEEELTNAIIKVAEQTQKTIYFLIGHGEPGLDDTENPEGYKTYAESLRAEGYSVETLSLLQGAEATMGQEVKLDEAKAKRAKLVVPTNVTLLIVAGARAPLLAPEVAALAEYARKGGRLLLLLEPDSDAGLGALLAEWKVELHKDLIVDTNPMNRLLGLGPAAPMVQPTAAQAEHPIIKSLTTPAVFMTARSMVVPSGGAPEVETAPLLETGESAWGETNLVGGSAALDEKDYRGPVTVALVATRAVGDADKRSSEGRVMVVGDSQWLNNRYLQVQGNRDLGVNIVHWLAEEQQRIAIRPKSRAASQLYLTGEQMAQIKFLSLDILPVLVVALGLGIVLVRRQR